MINGQDIFAQREQIKKSLNQSLTKAYESGLELAEKTRVYRVALAQEIMKLKSEGVQISILEKVAKGNVADMEFDMNVAEVLYKASNENINAQKKLLESVEADIKREVYVGER